MSIYATFLVSHAPMVQKMDAYLVLLIQHFPVIKNVALVPVIPSIMPQDFSIITNVSITALLGSVLIQRIKFVFNLVPLKIVCHVQARSHAGQKQIA